MKHHEIKHPPPGFVKSVPWFSMAKKRKNEDPVSRLAAGKTSILGENYRSHVRSVVSGSKDLRPRKKTSNFHLDPQSVWHLSRGNCHDRLFIILAIVKSAVNWNEKQVSNSLGCHGTPTPSISREIDCHVFCTVSLAYSFLVSCVSDNEHIVNCPLFCICFFDIKGASFIAEVKSSAQPAGFRDRTGVVDIAPRITTPFLGCKHQDLKHRLNKNVWSLHWMQSQKRNEEIIKKNKVQFVLSHKSLWQPAYQATWSVEVFQPPFELWYQVALQPVLSQSEQPWYAKEHKSSHFKYSTMCFHQIEKQHTKQQHFEFEWQDMFTWSLGRMCSEISPSSCCHSYLRKCLQRCWKCRWAIGPDIGMQNHTCNLKPHLDSFRIGHNLRGKECDN